MEGTPLPDVLSVLSDQGFSGDEAVRFCAQLYDDPAFEAGCWLAEQQRKIESVLDMREQMRRLSTRLSSVDRRSGVSREEFLDQYYAANTPVLMTDVCADWPAITLWNPAYLAGKLGGVEVEVMANRDADPDYEMNSDEHKFLMPFDEYVAKVEATDRGNDVYLVANNKLLATPAAAPLWDDFETDSRYLVPDPEHGQAYLWFGPAGTVTPMHHDSLNVLFNQVTGRKHIILIPSLAIHRMYNHVAVYSEIDPIQPDLERYPKYAEVSPIHLDIQPGETLFIPIGWWHHVVATEPSISVTFTNFAFDNSVEMEHPERAY